MADEIVPDPFDVDEEDVRLRVESVIAALFPNPQTRPDTREGSLVYTLTAPYIKEVARFYSDLYETLKMAFLDTAEAEYLDAKAVEIGLLRKEAGPSIGEVRFFGDDGTTIPLGTTVSTSVDVPEELALSFETNTNGADGNPVPQVDRTIVGINSPVLAATPVAIGSGGITGDVVYRYTYITALSREETFYGETLSSPNSVVSTVSGQIIEVTIPTPVPVYTELREIIGARVYRALDFGSGYSDFKAVATIEGDLSSPVSVIDDISNTDFVLILDTIPLSNTTGYIDIDCTAVEDGVASNITARQIQFLEDPVAGVTKVTNPLIFSSGAEIESDEEFRERLLEEVQKPAGAGNISDYIGWAKSIIGVDSAYVIPEWEAQFGDPNGPGTVKVIIAGANNTLVNSTLIEQVRKYIAGDIGLESPYDLYAGITMPAGSVSSTGGFMSDAQYSYVYTFVNVGGGETPHSAIDLDGEFDGSQALEVSVSSGTNTASVALSGILTGPTGTSVENTIRRRIYRKSSASTDTKYFLVGEIPNNFDTVFLDTINDSAVSLRYAPTVNSTSLFNGQAPIGAHITIESISQLTVRVESTIVPLAGYNLLGSGGNINLGNSIRTSLNNYFNSLAPGETIYYVDVQNAIHDTAGVKDFRNTSIFTPDFPFGTTDNIENTDNTVKPVFNPAGVLVEVAE